MAQAMGYEVLIVFSTSSQKSMDYKNYDDGSSYGGIRLSRYTKWKYVLLINYLHKSIVISRLSKIRLGSPGSGPGMLLNQVPVAGYGRTCTPLYSKEDPRKLEHPPLPTPKLKVFKY